MELLSTGITVCAKSLQSCLTLCDPTDCSLPGSSAHEISQARILEWVAVSFSRGTSLPRDQTSVSFLASGFFPTESPGKTEEGVQQSTLVFEGHLIKGLFSKAYRKFCVNKIARSSIVQQDQSQ